MPLAANWQLKYFKSPGPGAKWPGADCPETASSAAVLMLVGTTFSFKFIFTHWEPTVRECFMSHQLHSRLSSHGNATWPALNRTNEQQNAACVICSPLLTNGISRDITHSKHQTEISSRKNKKKHSWDNDSIEKICMIKTKYSFDWV